MSFFYLVPELATTVRVPFLNPDMETLQDLEKRYPLPPTYNFHTHRFQFWGSKDKYLKELNKINTLYWPGTMATRWGIFRGLVDNESLDILLDPSSGSKHTFVIDGEPTVSKNMYLSSYQNVTGYDNRYNLVVLVDERYLYAKKQTLDTIVFSDTKGWPDYITDNTDYVYNFVYGTPSSDFGKPDPDSVLSNVRSEAEILDLAAWNTGTTACYVGGAEFDLVRHSQLKVKPDISFLDAGTIVSKIPHKIVNKFPVWSDVTGWSNLNGSIYTGASDARDYVSHDYDVATSIPSLADNVNPDLEVVFVHQTKNADAVSVTADNIARANAICDEMCFLWSYGFYYKFQGVADIPDGEGFSLEICLQPDDIYTIVDRNNWDENFGYEFHARTTPTIPSTDWLVVKEAPPSIVQKNNVKTIEFKDSTVTGTDGFAIVDIKDASLTNRGLVNLQEQELGTNDKHLYGVGFSASGDPDLAVIKNPKIIRGKTTAGAQSDQILSVISNDSLAYDFSSLQAAIVRLVSEESPFIAKDYNSYTSDRSSCHLVGTGDNFNLPALWTNGSGIRLENVYTTPLGYSSPTSLGRFGVTADVPNTTVRSFAEFDLIVAMSGFFAGPSRTPGVSGTDPIGNVFTSGILTTLGSGGGGGGQASIQYQDEGLNLGTAGTVTAVNFTGAGVTATRSANTVTVNIPGGGGGGGATGGMVEQSTVVSGAVTSIGDGLPYAFGSLPVAVFNIPFMGVWATGLTYTIPMDGLYHTTGKARVFMSAGGGSTVCLLHVYANGFLVPNSTSIYQVNAGTSVQQSLTINTPPTWWSAGTIITLRAQLLGVVPASAQVQNDVNGHTELTSFRIALNPPPSPPPPPPP